jgi:hypothetical protein
MGYEGYYEHGCPVRGDWCYLFVYIIIYWSGRFASHQGNDTVFYIPTACRFDTLNYIHNSYQRAFLVYQTRQRSALVCRGYQVIGNSDGRVWLVCPSHWLVLCRDCLGILSGCVCGNGLYKSLGIQEILDASNLEVLKREF